MEPEASPSSLRGQLLVATPPLVDPNFDRTVVLLLEHGEEGALGLVCNRPTDRVLGDVVPEWGALASAPAVVYIGGPVAPEAVITLARARASGASDGWMPVLGDLGTVDIGRDPSELGLEIDELRVFAGYTGWGAGQLESELDVGAWFVVHARPSDPFTSEPAVLWRSVLRRQRGRLALFAHCPGDPSVN